jgi:secreted trypsin-like serine protease
MKKIGVILSLALLLAFLATPAAAITWGEPDTTHANVGAMVVDYPGYGPWQVCSGTLIHPRVFLTAGHCTSGWEGTGVETFWVNFDPYALNLATLREVEQVITHPEYGWGGSDPHDVGLLILAEPVLDIQPAVLPYAGFLDDLKKTGLLHSGPQGAKITVVGYGGVLAWPPPEITYDDWRRIAYSEYVALTKPWLHLSQNTLQGNGGTCAGDSGGPGFYTQPNGTEILVGITSWGDPVCVATGFDYRVDTPATLNFIRDVIAGLE